MSPLLKTSSSPQTEAAMIQLLVVQPPFPSTPLCSATAMQPSLWASGPLQLLISLAVVVFLHLHTQARTFFVIVPSVILTTLMPAHTAQQPLPQNLQYSRCVCMCLPCVCFPWGYEQFESKAHNVFNLQLKCLKVSLFFFFKKRWDINSSSYNL